MKLETSVIGVIGLGYVGLPLAVSFARKYKVVGFDINAKRIAALKRGEDSTNEADRATFDEVLAKQSITFTSDETALQQCDVIIVSVPTPIDCANQPDLEPLVSASQTIGRNLKKGCVVIFESTTFPTCTEKVCGAEIERVSGMRYNEDFFMGYSPERINPADKVNRFETIKKITSGSTPEVADFVDALYNSVLKNGTHRAPSMAVAEAAKAVENAQRDVNIAFVNEIAMLCGHLGIDSRAVLEAAGTKWNFIKMQPGLVGGHCISVDPYYLTYIGRTAGYECQLINAGRAVNNGVVDYIVGELLKILIKANSHRVLMLGCSFKEGCGDIRNSKIFDIIAKLNSYGVSCSIYDPYVDYVALPKSLNIAKRGIVNGVIELGSGEVPTDDSQVQNYFLVGQLNEALMSSYDLIVLGVSHPEFMSFDYALLHERNVSIYDVKGVLDKANISSRL